MKMKIALSLLPAISALLLLNSCGGNSKKNTDIENQTVSDKQKFILLPDADSILPEWSTENIVVNHWVGDPDNLHPTNGTNTARSWVFQYTCNYILRSDVLNLDICPDLAVAMPEVSADHLQYTYTLRKDARWDDGTPITAEDCFFMLKVQKCPLVANPQGKPYFENIKTVQLYPDDPYKFTIVMKQEYYHNIVFLTDYPVIERKFYDPENILANYSFDQFNDSTFEAEKDPKLTAWANEFNDQKYGNDISLLNGSGPYKVVEWTRQQSLILERKKDHWTKKLADPTIYETAYPEKIIFKYNVDPNAEMLEFRAQTIDASVWLSTQIVMELKNDPAFNKNYNLQFTDNYSYNYIGFNMRPDGITHKKIFDDVKVRRAFAYLTPVDDMMQVIAYGYAKRQASAVSPLKAEYNTDLALIPLDIETAKKLLDEAGWKDTDGDNIRDKMIDGVKTPLQVELKFPSGQKFVEDMANMIKQSMYLGGVDLVLTGMEGNTLKDQMRSHDFDMYLGAWSTGSMPEDFTQVWHTSSYASGGSNYVGFGNASSDALIDSIKSTVDVNKRTVLVKKLQKEIYDQQPYVFLYSAAKKNIIHKRFGNQYMTFDRPGVVLNNLRLLSLYGSETGLSSKETGN